MRIALLAPLVAPIAPPFSGRCTGAALRARYRTGPQGVITRSHYQTCLWPFLVFCPARFRVGARQEAAACGREQVEDGLMLVTTVTRADKTELALNNTQITACRKHAGAAG
jgi:hypothetical protein